MNSVTPHGHMIQIMSPQLGNSLQLEGSHSATFDPAAVMEGVSLADFLTQLAPAFFTPEWRSKIIADASGNWRLRVSEGV